MSKKALTNKKDHPKKEDQLRVMLALSNDDISDSGPCPDLNDMAAFVDGTIEREKNKKIVAHLNTCHDCYSDWLMVSSAVAEPEKSSLFNVLKLIFKDTMPRYLTDLSNLFKLPKPVFTYGFATAVAACLVLVFWAVKSTNLEDLINNSYTDKVVAGISQDDLEFNNIYKLPWERPKDAFGFDQHPPDSDSARAFGTGLWAARQEVLGDQEYPTKPDFVAEEPAWQTSPKAIYFWLGRWSYLLRAMCMSDEKISRDFWGKQLEILKKIQQKVSDSYNTNNEILKMVTPQLDNIKSILSKSDEGALNRENRRDIAAEIDFIINSLSPKASEKG